MAEPDSESGNAVVESGGDGEVIEEGSRGAVLTEARYSSGPIPTPEEFQRYGKVLSDAPERILGMAEREQDIRHDGYRAAAANDRLRILGSIIVSLALIVASVLIAYAGYPWVSVSLGLSGLGGIIARWVLFRQSSDAE